MTNTLVPALPAAGPRERISPDPHSCEVARLLDRAQQGEVQAAEDLLPLIYDELRRLAARKMAHEAAGHTLQPTALVHEAWLRLVGNGNPSRWNNRRHFFAAAAEAMRRILIDAARRKQSRRRGGEWAREEIEDGHLIVEQPSQEILAVDEALEKLIQEDKLAADLVKLRYFVGLNLIEAADALAVSPRTADRLWAYARSWLRLELGGAS